MKNEEVQKMLGGMSLPGTEEVTHQQELKIPLLSYRKSSKVGLWLLVLPLLFALTVLLKYELDIHSSFLDFIERVFHGIDNNGVLTYLIPIIFAGLPLFAMIINFLAFSHFAFEQGKKELLVTIKCRPLNFAVFLLSFAVLIFFLLPDTMP
jgi:hypothetical protein